MAEPPFNNKSSNRGKKRSIDEINGTVEHREATRARDHDYFCSNQILQREQHHNFQHQLRSSTMANHTNPMVRGLRESYIAALEVANAATRARAITSGSNIAHGSNTTANNTFTRYRISSGTHIIGSQVVASTNNAITGGSLSGSSNISNGITSYAAQQVPDTIKDDTFYESDDDDQTSIS
ncbi:hypothetical protein SBRCBS47491_001417 [Sporothrix bragantina]|uniref:Uncharacterized protein n=1 Tax=Sporothrix bragantina TaxID=671064 RepID=A0ABP0AYF8_9PEZI